jgi:hypothetical protein
MKTQSYKSSFLLSTIAGIAVILLGVAGVVRIMGWLPNSIGGFGNILAIEVVSAASANPVAEPVDMDLPQASGNVRSKRRCPECSVIVSILEVDSSGPNASLGAVGHKVASNENGMRGTSARSYEFTVRMESGSRRVIVAANRAGWSPGQRVIVID